MLASLGCVVLAIGMHAQRYGRELALSPDSVSYLSAARHLAAGDGLVRFDGAPFLLWPPLYPWCLAGLEWLGMDALAYGAWLQWLALGGTALLTGWWVGSRTNSVPRIVLASLAVLASRPLWHVSVFLWSEPLFNFLVLTSLFFLARARQRGDVVSLALLAVTCAAACWTRYAGLFLVAASVLVLLLPDRRAWRPRVLVAGAFAAAALLPSVLWWIRNTRLTGDWSGGRVAGGLDAIWGFDSYARTMADWLLPWSWPLALKGPLALLLLALVAAGAYRVVQRGDDRSHTIAACAAFVAVYSVGILGLGFVTVFNFPDHRILSPLMAPLVVLAGVAWPAAKPGAALRFFRSALLAAAALGLLVWIARSAIVARRWVRIQLQEERTLSSPRWKESALAAAVAVRSPEELLYSNMPHVIYLYGGRDCLRSPRRHYFGAEERGTDDLRVFEEGLRRFGVARLAWFDLPMGSYVYTPDEMPSFVSVTLESRHEDGVLYRLEYVAPAGVP